MRVNDQCPQIIWKVRRQITQKIQQNDKPEEEQENNRVLSLKESALN